MHHVAGERLQACGLYGLVCMDGGAFVRARKRPGLVRLGHDASRSPPHVRRALGSSGKTSGKADSSVASSQAVTVGC